MIIETKNLHRYAHSVIEHKKYAITSSYWWLKFIIPKSLCHRIVRVDMSGIKQLSSYSVNREIDERIMIEEKQNLLVLFCRIPFAGAQCSKYWLIIKY